MKKAVDLISKTTSSSGNHLHIRVTMGADEEFKCSMNSNLTINGAESSEIDI